MGNSLTDMAGLKRKKHNLIPDYNESYLYFIELFFSDVIINHVASIANFKTDLFEIIPLSRFCAAWKPGSSSTLTCFIPDKTAI